MINLKKDNKNRTLLGYQGCIMAASSSSRKVNIPASARSGLVLLLLGALIVGLGSYFDRGALSLYGLVTAIAGFLVYIISSVKRARHDKRRRSKA